MAEGTEGVDWVTTPAAIVDADRNRIVYVAGSRVPMADAVKYGLVDKRAKKPAEDRAKKPAEDRTVTSTKAAPLKRVRRQR